MGDVWCIDLREAVTKTAAGARLVPVLPALDALGFIEYAARRQETGEPFLFGKSGEAWSKWGNRYLDQIGISNNEVTLHSLRHNFRQMLRASGIGEELSNKVFGHDNGTAGSGYGRALSSAEAKRVHSSVVIDVAIGGNN
jgi:integrase